MGPTTPTAAPPVTAEYTSALQPPKSNLPPAESSYRFTRATDGKTRVDSGKTSVISDPAAGQTILLDHAKKTAMIAPQPAPQIPGMPQMPHLAPPGMPAAPQPPAMQVQDLGKSVLQGHEVEGKRYVIPPPPKPKAPLMPSASAGQAPAMPKLPQAPGMPKLPQMAGAPKPPSAPPVPGVAPPPPPAPGAPPPPPAAGAPPARQLPTTAEVWTSPSMQLPMLTKMKGNFGQLTQVCHRAVPGEPHPAAFQIPPGYKVITPQRPKPPAMPKPPAVPNLPAAPKPPAMPKL
jgi:hypothetical protein